MTLIVTYLVGMALLFAELFVPGVVLGIAGGVLILYALGAAWMSGDVLVAGALTITTLVAVPLMVRFALRKLSLDSSLKAEEGFAASEEGLSGLVGKTGTTLTPLGPSGTAEIDGRRVSVLAEMGFIEADTPVRVLRFDGNRVVVRAVPASDLAVDADGAPDRNRI